VLVSVLNFPSEFRSQGRCVEMPRAWYLQSYCVVYLDEWLLHIVSLQVYKWALEKTAGGKPVMDSASHSGWGVGSVWVACHLMCHFNYTVLLAFTSFYPTLFVIPDKRIER